MLNFCNAYADVNADADADIPKCSWEIVVSYLGKKVRHKKFTLSIILRINLIPLNSILT